MKQKLVLALGVLLLCGLALTGCENGSTDDEPGGTNPLIGTWKDPFDDYTIEFTATLMKLEEGDGEFPYTLSGTTLTVDASSMGQGAMTATATVSGSILNLRGFPQESGLSRYWIRHGDENDETNPLVGTWKKQSSNYTIQFTAVFMRSDDGICPYTLSGTDLTVDASSVEQGTINATATISDSTLTLSGFPPETGFNDTWTKQ
jgi:type 1 fimbria pilin